MSKNKKKTESLFSDAFMHLASASGMSAIIFDTYKQRVINDEIKVILTNIQRELHESDKHVKELIQLYESISNSHPSESE